MNVWKKIGVLLICLLIFFMVKNQSVDFFKKSDQLAVFDQLPTLKQECAVDLIGFSMRGEFFDVIQYKAENVLLKKDIKPISKWGNRTIAGDAKIGQWKECPIDDETKALFSLELDSTNFENSCFQELNRKLSQPGNFYAYIYADSGGSYFMFYTPKSNKLVYIRRNGV